MVLQTSGTISLDDIHVEATGSTGTQATINDTDIRGLIEKTISTQMAFSEWYGAAYNFVLNISANTQEANVSTLSTAAGWNGTAPLIVNISSSIYVWSDNTSIAGLIISGSFPGGLTVNNSGYIIGRGGNGGAGEANGLNGGPAISNASSSVSIVNNTGAFIAGGGGGGGGGKGGVGTAGGGGGAGGGDGGPSADPSRAGGAGGAVGQVGGNPALVTGASLAGAGGSGGLTLDYDDGKGYGGWGGGRQLPGAAGVYSAQGYPGAGGGAGNAGTGGQSLVGSARHASGGGGWGAAGGSNSRTSGGAGGAAISGTAVSLTNNGTIFGTTST